MEKEQYQSGNHEAIIDPETFEMVQRELARRTKQQDARSPPSAKSSGAACWFMPRPMRMAA
jgi:hypothetical protein